jgi:hypothetical protein
MMNIKLLKFKLHDDQSEVSLVLEAHEIACLHSFWKMFFGKQDKWSDNLHLKNWNTSIF